MGGGCSGRFFFEYETDEGELAFGWALAAAAGSDWIPAHQVHKPAQLAMTNATMAALLFTQYNKREVMFGHHDLVPSLKRIDGGVKRSQIKCVIANVALSAVVLVGNGYANSYLTTATLFEDTNGAQL